MGLHWQPPGCTLLPAQSLWPVLRLHLGSYNVTTPACRPVNAVCLADLDACNSGQYRRCGSAVLYVELGTCLDLLGSTRRCELASLRWLCLPSEPCYHDYDAPCPGSSHSR